MAAAWQAYRWNSARPNDSSIRFGSSAHTCTHPEAIAGSSARISDQITEPFPDPVAPAISTCVAASRSRQGEPSSHRPDRQPGQVHLPGDRQGADRVGQGVGADQLQHHHARVRRRGCGTAGRRTRAPGSPPGPRSRPGPARSPARPAPGPPPRPGAPGPAPGASAGPGSPARARPGSWRPSTGAGRTTTRSQSRTGPATNRANHDGCRTRSPASPTTAIAARPTRPGQPRPSQVTTTSAATASTPGWVRANQSTRQIRRTSWTTMITGSGVR